MGKLYAEAGPEVGRRIETLRGSYYAEDLDGVQIAALFVADPDGNKQVLKHHGYPAAAVIRVVNERDRASGMADAQLLIDQLVWISLDTKKQTALLDHELYHLEAICDKHGARLFDGLDRPRLRIRKHDWQLGWFDEIAKRHAEHSIEVLEAKRLLKMSGQLYFDFGAKAEAA